MLKIFGWLSTVKWAGEELYLAFKKYIFTCSIQFCSILFKLEQESSSLFEAGKKHVNIVVNIDILIAPRFSTFQV